MKNNEVIFSHLSCQKHHNQHPQQKNAFHHLSLILCSSFCQQKLFTVHGLTADLKKPHHLRTHALLCFLEMHRAGDPSHYERRLNVAVAAASAEVLGIGCQQSL